MVMPTGPIALSKRSKISSHVIPNTFIYVHSRLSAADQQCSMLTAVWVKRNEPPHLTTSFAYVDCSDGGKKRPFTKRNALQGHTSEDACIIFPPLVVLTDVKDPTITLWRSVKRVMFNWEKTSRGKRLQGFPKQPIHGMNWSKPR